AFFGERAPLPAGAAELALRTGAALVPAFVLRDDGGFRIVIDPPLALSRTADRAADLATAHRAAAAALECGIARAPDQWFALKPVWSGLAR
ncbi:MAG: lipid A biosynthesis acyltransferase, partial [Chloroflexi bacterium]|nr:lipid A biosynthesis acyltransferase [Chloroflexota bacterium]